MTSSVPGAGQGAALPPSPGSPGHAPRSGAPLAVLRVQILAARNLAPMDRNGLADPFITVAFVGGALPPPTVQNNAKPSSSPAQQSQRRSTSVAPKTLNPQWPSAEATFDLPILPDWLGLVDEESGAPVPSNRRPRIAGRAASAALVPIRLTARGAAAGARAVRSRTPRPIIIGVKRRRQQKEAATAAAAAAAAATASAHAPGINQLELIPSRGSIALSRPHAALKAGIVSGIELVVWDKDRYTKNDYMGEVSVPVEMWAPALAASRLLASSVPGVSATAREGSDSIIWDEAQPFWVPLRSSRLNNKKKVTGELQLKIGLLSVPETSVDHERASPAPGPAAAPAELELPTLADVYQALLLARLDSDNASVRAVPADQSVGTAQASDPFLDDGLSSGSEDEDEESDDESEDEMEELESDDEGAQGSGSEESFYDTENEMEGTADDAEDDFYQSLGVAKPGGPGQKQDSVELVTSAKDAAVLNQASIIPPVEVPPTATEPGPLAAPAEASSATAANLPAPPTRPENKTRRSFRGLLSRPKSSRSASANSSLGGPAAVAAAAATTLDGGASQGDGKRRIPRLRKRTQDSQGLETGAAGADIEKRQGKGVRRKKTKAKKRRSRASRAGAEYSFKTEAGLDIIGIVMLEVKSANHLPRWKGMIGGFDMDPFAVISFGQKIYRTRVCRHTLNPVWDEKLLFHVRRYETNFQIKAAVYDWDRISSHDYCGGISLDVAELIAKAPTPDPETGLYAAALDLDQELSTYELPLEGVPDRDATNGAGETKVHHELASAAAGILNKLSIAHHGSPVLTLRAKFQPYAALRQRFWRQLLKQFDTDDSGTLSFLELSSMLDSLGATLSRETIMSWFENVGKNADVDSLTLDQAIAALEGEVRKPESQKRKAVSGFVGDSGAHTPMLLRDMGREASGSSASGLDVSGLQARVGDLKKPVLVPEMSIEPPTPVATEGASVWSGSSSQGVDPAIGGHARKIEHNDSSVSAASVQTGVSTTSTTSSEPSDIVRERIITLKKCPLCHMPRLSKKADGDVITHLAVCASQDWRRVDSLMVSNFVTASQAHRKWFTKVVNKISHGSYQLGANSANILAIDRRTGEICEEKMPVYVRLGIRLLYQGARSRMEGARIKRMLAAMSVKQGVKYDSPASKAEIPAFIAFHNLDITEVRDPLDSFATFNEFFYRRLKEGARPIDSPSDPNVLVSAADCRLMAFNTVTSATNIWVKGRDFTIERLLGDEFKSEAPKYTNGGGFCIFRLAPQDYHRFHCPADATVGRISRVDGQYYTVNPMAIRSAIDVYGENVREVVEFHSEQFGTFYVVCIGAMMVGSIGMEIKTGQQVKRGDPFGWFAFGGSTLCMVLPPGVCQFDEDLIENSNRALETLVRVGMRLGVATGAVANDAQ
ncbi:phosphatidylserine decarboxylase [Tilletia horrida]|uniref:phosphatidylserine decarboxylase n=1 Tax=Tilletia horrida TaxID=155126 RepID=A0AAN6JTX2_9BASI|nr:phosphatidylserine decarboxylase [Tilletia horrida]KAK0556194.1 phosphatidylserine decarboxylase [Tilletia horrida]KAK0569143.1 phosphatidylserine decarboxylase [Tilletia horrida]